MASAEPSWKDSAQSPAWSRKALPSDAMARCSPSRRTSPAKTSGGFVANCVSTRARWASSGQVTPWVMGRERQEVGVHSFGSAIRQF